MSTPDDATLLKMAEAEILGEAKRAAVRHSTLGIAGWRSGPKANKLFLANTIIQTVASNRIFTRKQEQKHVSGSSVKKKKERKLLQKEGKNPSNYIFKKPNLDISKSTSCSIQKQDEKKKTDIYKKDFNKVNSRKREQKRKNVHKDKS